MKHSAIRKLDLGGTACYESKEAIGISLDGSMSEDFVTEVVQGDYRAMPFPSEYFDEAFGGCFLENYYQKYTREYREVYRVLKPGAKLTVSSCGPLHKNHLAHALACGFELVEEAAEYVDPDDPNERWLDAPYVFRKPLG